VTEDVSLVDRGLFTDNVPRLPTRFLRREFTMVSSTQQFDRIRKRKATTNGKRNKRERRAMGTPKFAVHPEGYNPSAADAKPTAK
jgi:hypothetical protein